MKKEITTTFTEKELRAIIREEVSIALTDHLNKADSKSEGFLNISEAAEFLKLKTGSIYNFVNKQKIPFHKKPGSNRILFVKSELVEWLKEEK